MRLATTCDVTDCVHSLPSSRLLSADGGIGGTDCAQSSAASADTITIRGPGDGTSGFCLVSNYSLINNDKVSLTDSEQDSRANNARRVRITMDPASQADPRLRVYYSPDSTDDGLELVVNEAVPAAVLAETSFKWGFGAGSSTLTDNKGASRRPCRCAVWVVCCASITTYTLTETGFGAGCLGCTL